MSDSLENRDPPANAQVGLPTWTKGMSDSLENRDRLKNGTGLTTGNDLVNGRGFTRVEGWELNEDQKLVKKKKKKRWWRR
jgi:hypothetical protein